MLERGSFYQCQFSFKNGNGYGIFTPDAQLTGGLRGAGTGAGGGAGGQASFYDSGALYTNNSFDAQRNANRSVFYYKGVTYFGTCFGMPDIEARTIVGSANATSDPDAVSTSQGGGSGGSLQNTSTIIENNTGFSLNCGWEAKIHRTKPTLRFRGKGELAVLSPTGNSSLTNLAFDAYRSLIGAIVQSTSNLQNATNAPVNFTSSQQAIDQALDSLRDKVSETSGTDATYREADVTPLLVNGTRRYF